MARKKEHFMARKQVFQIQHGYLDITLYLRHWYQRKNQVKSKLENPNSYFSANNESLLGIRTIEVLWVDFVVIGPIDAIGNVIEVPGSGQ